MKKTLLMKTILMYLVFGLFEDSVRSAATERYNDSLQIYTTYLNQMKIVAILDPGDTALWNKKVMRSYMITCAAQTRLAQYNHEPYRPSDSLVREHRLPAYLFPKPTMVPKVSQYTSSKSYSYVVYDRQTRFLIKDNGQTRLPYISRIVFDNGIVISIEKLDPITYEKIP